MRSLVYNHGQSVPSQPFSYIDIGSINNIDLCLNEIENIIQAKDAPSRARRIVEMGDILYSTVRPYLHNMCIVDRIFSAIPIASTGFAVMACYPGVVNSYLFLYLQSPQFDQYANDGDNAKGVAYPAINDEKLYKALIPVPPKNEQNRIVEFISTIQPSLNRYNSSQRKIDDLNRGIKPMLRKSILQEAIQGKLVPQEPKEKPATFLLEQIREEKQKLLREGLLKKKDIVDSVIFKGEDNKYYEKVDGKTLEISEEIPFDIPESWAWVRLGSVVTNEAGLAYSKDCLTDRSQPLIRVLRGGNIEEGRWSIKDDDVIISKKYVKESLLLKHGTFITPAVTSIERMAKTALIQEDHHDIVVGGFVLMIKPVIIDNALLQYLNLFFQTTYYKKYCISITNKSGQAFYNLSRQKLMQCLVPIPPEKEQYRIADKYSQLTL